MPALLSGHALPPAHHAKCWGGNTVPRAHSTPELATTCTHPPASLSWGGARGQGRQPPARGHTPRQRWTSVPGPGGLQCWGRFSQDSAAAVQWGVKCHRPAQVPAPEPASCAPWGWLHSLSVPHFPCLHNAVRESLSLKPAGGLLDLLAPRFTRTLHGYREGQGQDEAGKRQPCGYGYTAGGARGQPLVLWSSPALEGSTRDGSQTASLGRNSGQWGPPTCHPICCFVLSEFCIAYMWGYCHWSGLQVPYSGAPAVTQGLMQARAPPPPPCALVPAWPGPPSKATPGPCPGPASEPAPVSQQDPSTAPTASPSTHRPATWAESHLPTSSSRIEMTTFPPWGHCKD